MDMNSIHQKFINIKRLRDHLVKSFVQTRWVKHLTKLHTSSNEDILTEFSRMESQKFRDMDYVSWLQVFFQFETIPRYVKYKQSDYSVCVHKSSNNILRVHLGLYSCMF